MYASLCRAQRNVDFITILVDFAFPATGILFRSSIGHEALCLRAQDSALFFSATGVLNVRNQQQNAEDQ
jgi:hypothetical protein